MPREARRRKSGFSTKTTLDWSPGGLIFIGYVICFVIGFVAGAISYAP